MTINDIEAAAIAGDVNAQYEFGMLYYEGNRLPEDHIQAKVWLRQAATKGHAKAQHNLGVLLYEESPETAERQEAIRWILSAANQGLVDSQIAIAQIYLDGTSIPKNDIEAYLWFNLAAAAGDEEASLTRDKLGRHMSREEISVAQERSRLWWRKMQEKRLNI
jgi:TPR repeat protein